MSSIKIINSNIFGGGGMTKLLFKDGHTETVGCEIKTGNVVFDSATMIPIVVSISCYCQNTSSQWNCNGTFKYNGVTIGYVSSSPHSGGTYRTKGEFSGILYLPASFDNFEHLSAISNFTSSFSYNDYGSITVNVLQWIERK